MKTQCPCCGVKFETKSQSQSTARVLPVPGAGASEREIYAYYKRIAPYEDLKFSRRRASPELQAEIDILLVGKPTAKDAARIRDKRRAELAEADRAERRLTVPPPTEYLDWTTKAVHPTNCRHCGRGETLHTGTEKLCRYDAYKLPDEPTYFELADPYEVQEWAMVPAEVFEAKWKRIAEVWS